MAGGFLGILQNDPETSRFPNVLELLSRQRKLAFSSDNSLDLYDL